MNSQWSKPNYPAPWERSRAGILGGICQGLGEHLKIEPWILRVLWVGLILFMGTGIFFYVVLWIALPQQGDNTALKRPMFLGVCSKIAQKWYWDIGLTRAVVLLLTAFSFGLTFLFYIIAYFFIPPKNSEKIVYK